MCLASNFSRLCRAAPWWIRRGPAAGICRAAVAAGVDITTKIREFISYVDCLIGDRNESWRTHGSHILYLCFDPGCVQPHSSSLVVKFRKVGYPASRAFFEQDGIISVVEVREIFISDVYSQITSAAADDSCRHDRREHGSICILDVHWMLWGPPCLTRDVVPVWRSTISLRRNGDTLMQRRAFQRAFLSTVSKEALMSM